MESYIIKYRNISPPSIVSPDVLVGDSKEIEECAAVVGALDHLVNVKALGSKEGKHGEYLSLDGSALSNGVLGTIGHIPALVSEVGAKGGLIIEEEGAISEFLHVLEAISVFTPKLNISWAIPIL